MTLKRLVSLLLISALSACATDDNRGRISELDVVNVELNDINVEGGLDKAMEGYQKFLEQTPETELTPEAIRRLADLKVEKEYGILTDGQTVEQAGASATSTKPISAAQAAGSDLATAGPQTNLAGNAVKVLPIADVSESEKDFEKRATAQQAPQAAEEPGADLKNGGAAEAIVLYNKLLKKYPMYEKNDQVLYQLSRAYEETGQVDEAMGVMNRLIKQFPNSRYIDEVQFRRGEYYFTRKKYLEAEDAYSAVLTFGVGSVYYERALFKKGWTFYKQELYEDALNQFIALLDYKVSIGYNFEQTSDEIEKKRVDDTFSVISLSFSNLGGATSVQEYFRSTGSRSYEDGVYSNLAEFFFSKRRYNDAATTYNAFVGSNPIHKVAPHFSMRVIEIYMKGGFPRLVIEAKKQFASTYGIHAAYWNYFDQKEYPKVIGYLKTNITDLANHYHSLYQNKKLAKNKPENFGEASHWYREFLQSFPKDNQSPSINYQLADLLLENKDFNLAAMEYERTAYQYPVNKKSPKAAYSAVYAYREHLKVMPIVQQHAVKRDIVRSSLLLVDNFPQHDKASVVLGAAVDDLFAMQDFAEAIKNGRRLIQEYAKADMEVRRGAWLVVAHSSYEIENYVDAEIAYIEVLALTKQDDKGRVKLVDNLAASIYKQGEQAKAKEDYKTAVKHYLRIADLAPTSKIRPSAEYDAAAVLIQIMELEQAESVLLAFRSDYPKHELQKDVTKKIAYVYKELGKHIQAAKEYERIATESEQEELIRDAMLTAAELYEKAKDTDNAIRVYQQFVAKFPNPLEFALETYYKIAMIYKSVEDISNYRKNLLHIITSDQRAGDERTDRTRYLAAQSSLVILEPSFEEFLTIKLVNPLEKSMAKKQKSMKRLVSSYGRLVDYKVADVTAASTYYIAEIYYNFNRSLLKSEIPTGLSALELEEFNLALEDQAYPFEEKTISVHEKNVELLTIGVYSPWVDRSIEKLAQLVPARYSKQEERMGYLDSVDYYRYSSPRFIREDAEPLLVEHLDLFRYVSQKHEQALNENSAVDDIQVNGLPNDQRLEGAGSAKDNLTETPLNDAGLDATAERVETQKLAPSNALLPVNEQGSDQANSPDLNQQDSALKQETVLQDVPAAAQASKPEVPQDEVASTVDELVKDPVIDDGQESSSTKEAGQTDVASVPDIEKQSPEGEVAATDSGITSSVSASTEAVNADTTDSQNELSPTQKAVEDEVTLAPDASQQVPVNKDPVTDPAVDKTVQSTSEMNEQKLAE